MYRISSAEAQESPALADTAFSPASVLLKQAVCHYAGADQAQGESCG